MRSKRTSSLVNFFASLKSETTSGRCGRFLHFWVFTGKSFVRNRCFIRASALSFTTLLALIPLLAVAISVSSSLLKSEGEQGIENFVQKFINGVMPPATLDDEEPENVSSNATQNASGSTNQNVYHGVMVNVAGGSPHVETNQPSTSTNSPASPRGDRVTSAQKKVAKEIHNFIQKTQSGTLGATGMLMLVFMAIRMLSSVEATFNDIWGVMRGRGWIASTILYWAVITLGPLLLVGAIGLASGSRFQSTQHLIHHTPVIGGLIFHLLPFVVLWLTFALIYQFLPNTKVHFRAALVGAIVGGSAWQLNNIFGFLYVSRVVTNNKIYGSLGLVPVFMAGIYLSWLILLFGAQVAYAFQNRKTFSEEKMAENINQRGREFIALRLMNAIGRQFQNGLVPATVSELSNELNIPSKIVENVLETLVGARLVVEIRGDDIGYTPSRPLEAITAYDVLKAIRCAGQELPQTETRTEVLGEFAKIEAAEREAASRITLLTMVHRDRKQIEKGES
ncbi:MAG TPA: YhjD/YihY/BrkB family envelope integrity protein [Verrucomicrobiae bacterium]|nr:YhjD/YihY/BrkB family envelope integrity protein [Verrucomicrobiae bacterium]